MKNTLVPFTSTIANGPPELRTVMPDISALTILSPPLKILSRTKGTAGGNAILCHQDLTWSSCAHGNYACLSHIALVSHEHVCSQQGPEPAWSFEHQKIENLPPLSLFTQPTKICYTYRNDWILIFSFFIYLSQFNKQK